MADISALGELRPVEPLDLENYADNRGGFTIPRKGRYTVQAPQTFPNQNGTNSPFGRSKAGALTAQIDPTIVGPTNEGFQLRFTKPSFKLYKRNGVNVSQGGDYLRACGLRQKLNDEQEQADAVESTSGLTYQVDVDWKAYRKRANGTSFSVDGMENFPSDGNGGNLPWIDDPEDFERDEATGEFSTDAQGNKIPVRIRANAYINGYIPSN